MTSPEELAFGDALSAAQRNLPWWLRPPLRDASSLRPGADQLVAGYDGGDDLLFGGGTKGFAVDDPRSDGDRHHPHRHHHHSNGGLGWGANDGGHTPLLGKRSSSFGGRHIPGSLSADASLFSGGGGGGRAAATASLARPSSLSIGLSRLPSFMSLARGGASGMRHVPSDVMLAVTRPMESLVERVFDALPADLSAVLRALLEVVTRAAFDRGHRQTTERQIRAVLHVVGTLASHASRALVFSWVGRRKLLGGLAAFEEMLGLQSRLQSTPPDGDGAGGAGGAAGSGGRRRFSSCYAGGAPNESTAAPVMLPGLLQLLAARERAYTAKLLAAAEPVGRHATGGGRCAARDPLSFGFDGSMVLDEKAEKALRQQSIEDAHADATGHERSTHGESELAEGRRGGGVLSWLWRPLVGAKPGVRTDLLVEKDVPLWMVYDGPHTIGKSPRGGWAVTGADGDGAGADGGGAGGDGGGAGGDVVARSYAGRMHELKARRRGKKGTEVHLLRSPPNWRACCATSYAQCARSPPGAGQDSPKEGSVRSAPPPPPQSPQSVQSPPSQPQHPPPPPPPPHQSPSAAEGPSMAGEPLWFHAVVTALHPDAQTCDVEYLPVAIEPRFGEGCDGARLNLLLPDLCVVT